jgi:hypothetical protein
MADPIPYRRIDPAQIDELQLAERPPLAIRWWIVLPLAVILAMAQSFLVLSFEFGVMGTYVFSSGGVCLVATQISIIAFSTLIILGLVVNPLLRVTGVIAPFNRGEMMTLFAAMFVSAGISTFGLVDQLLPLIAMPFNPQYNIPQRGWDKDIVPFLNPSLYISDPAVIEKFRQGVPDGHPVWTEVPWGVWFKPLAYWMIFVFGIYLMFYSLSMLLYDSWARREKLIFPLARLPEDMMHDEGAAPGTLPSTLKSPLFWVGFILVFALLSYNGACQAELIRGLKPITLGVKAAELKDMLSNSVFKGLSENPPAQYQFGILIIFVAVGIGFLLPLEISASIWIYYLMAMGMFLVCFWTAAAASVKSFSSDWLWENHFVSALGAGGLLAYSAAALTKMVIERVQDSGTMGEEAEVEARAWRIVGWDGLLFIASIVICLGWLAWCKVPVHWGLAFLAVVILVTVGLMRVVAEGGFYWFQLHVGPFHLAKMAGGWAAAHKAVVAPLMPIYSVLFLDIKTFMAPAVMNSFKMQDETRASRRWFHTIVVSAIIVTVLTAFVTILYLTYKMGANRASNWFFTSGPRSLLDQTQRLASGTAASMGGEFNWLFYTLGGAWVLFSLFMRRKFFWWLHPIGFVMLANPLITQLWFGFFLGWCCKKMAVKYGGRHMFARLRPAFIGLIFGQLVAAFLWTVTAAWRGWGSVKIDINIYGP